MNAQVALQNPLQHAIAKASKRQELIDAVIQVCGDQFIPSSELFHKPEIRKLVEDSNKLSIYLSDAYHAQKLGRVDYHVGTTRYAYGKPGAKGAKMSQRKRGVAMKTANALEVARPQPAAITAHKPVQITLQFEDAEEALDFMMKAGLMSNKVAGL
ncbi:MAG TPA: hypothetical protein VIY48_12075 [Candidatus Paceibacterota bacterium]